ncbi:hypothetical protein [Endozoicomonas elysicola]|uniref:hypothetical protein n=1 Tax=Endozoicomonas elysicola TaxID=305900 RepID=UPI0003A6A5C0|nr:hypothetical protein [Endozoicomonas elysicola]
MFLLVFCRQSLATNLRTLVVNKLAQALIYNPDMSDHERVDIMASQDEGGLEHQGKEEG